MPNKTAKYRIQDKNKRHAAIKKWKREQKKKRKELRDGKNEKPRIWMA